jgi:hypothetical protein
MPSKERVLVSAYRRILTNPKSSPNLVYKAAESLRELQGLTAKQQRFEEELPSEGLARLMAQVGDGR